MGDWQEGERHAEQAQRFFEAGQWQQALDELRQALQCNPYESDWHFGMGLTLDALERYDEAVQAFEQVLRLRGEDVETLLHLGTDLIRSGEPRRAIDVLQRAAKLDPDCEPAYCQRIVAHAQLGEHDEAETMFYLARQIVEECPTCYNHIAVSLVMRGDLERAAWCWQQTLRLDPDYPDVHANLALVHWRLGQHERARRDLLRQLRIAPDDVRTLMELGHLLIEMGRYAEAGEQFRRALEMDPTLPEAHLMLGELSLMTGHYDAAESRFERARRLDPDRPGVHLGLARVARHRGQADEARVLAEIERTRNNHTVGQVLHLAQLLIELDRPRDAVRVLTPVLEGRSTTVLETDEHVALALRRRGVAHLVSGKLEEGIADCRQALRFVPDHVGTLQNLVLAHLDAHRLKRAEVWLRRAERIEPWNPALRTLRYRLLRAQLAERWQTLRRRFRR